MALQKIAYKKVARIIKREYYINKTGKTHKSER
jgi:hypothetical protein